MCPLVEILHSKGYEITGSDNNESDTLNRVRALGIPVTLGQRAENIEGAEMIVYTAALLPDNPELCAAKASGIPTFERKEMLGAITRMFDDCICVCGTHGKTTTTSMLTQIFIQAGEDPSAVIGGKLPLTGTNGLVGKSEHMLCEACEFVDTFLSLSPDVCVLLNIDEDHLDYFKTLDNLIASFTKFASMTRKEVIYNGDDANTLRAIAGVKDKKFITFGLKEGNDFRADNIVLEHEFASFDIIKYGENVGRISLGIPGEHNVYNALAAIAAADNAGIPMDKIIACAEAFHGAGRRFEILKRINGITIADDYAHHPRELAATLTSVRGMFPGRRITALFQPHLYTRTRDLYAEFAEALSHADEVVLLPIYPAREEPIPGVTSELIARHVAVPCRIVGREALADTVAAMDTDVVVSFGAGNIDACCEALAEKLGAKS